LSDNCLSNPHVDSILTQLYTQKDIEKSRIILQLKIGLSLVTLQVTNGALYLNYTVQRLLMNAIS
jgi:hypothetical protein